MPLIRDLEIFKTHVLTIYKFFHFKIIGTKLLLLEPNNIIDDIINNQA